MRIKKLRKAIDHLDKKIVQLLAKRMKLASKIMQYKQQQKIPLRDFKREQHILKKQKELAKKLKISSTLVEHIFKRIFKN